MWLKEAELCVMGFKHVGEGVLISNKASIYNPANISIGDYSRIDDFCILSAQDEGIEIGRHSHIACFTSLLGKCRITFMDYSGTSARVSVYSSNDDYSGETICNPTIPDKYKKVNHAPVMFEEHSLAGAGSIILPGVTFKFGAVCGALSLVNKDVEEFYMVGGIPAKFIKMRSREMLNKRYEYEQETGGGSYG